MTAIRGVAGSTTAVLILVAFLWGAGFTSSKAAVADVPPLTAGFVRYFLASLILVPLYLRERRSSTVARPISRQTWIALVGLGLTAVTGYNAFFLGGLRFAPSSDSILLIPTINPVWTALAATLFIGEPPGKRLKIGMVIAIAGMSLVLIGGNAGELDRDRLIGNGMFVLAALVFGVSHVIGRVATRGISPIGATAIAGVIGGLALLPMAVIEGGLVQLRSAPTSFWMNIIFIAFAVTALGYVLWYRSVAQIGPGRTSFSTNLVPVFGLTLSAIFLAEYPSLLQLLGGAIMLGTVVWVTMERGTVSQQTVRKTDSGN